MKAAPPIYPEPTFTRDNFGSYWSIPDKSNSDHVVFHCMTGPAIIDPDRIEYYVNGIRITSIAEWKSYTYMLNEDIAIMILKYGPISARIYGQDTL